MDEGLNKHFSDKKVLIRDLIDIEEWQRAQDLFSSISSINLRTVDIDGNPITSPSIDQRLCKRLEKYPQLKKELCGNCLPTFLGGNATIDKNLSFTCVAGAHHFLIPLAVEDVGILCYVVLGPVVLVMRKAKEQYAKVVERFHIDLDDFWDAFVEIRVVSFARIQAMVDLVKHIGEHVLNSAYQSITIAEGVQTMTAMQPLQLNKFFNALLEVAMQITQADIGSVMLLDSSGEHLTINSSRGLSDEVVKNTSVRIGEGISGAAAQDRRAFLINKDTADNRIRSYLNRPSLASSLVVPIAVKDLVLGVLNIASLERSDVRFSQDTAKTIGKLIDLASFIFHAPAK